MRNDTQSPKEKGEAMSKKKPSCTVYVDVSNAFGIENAEDDSEWVRVERVEGGVMIDRGGELLLDPKHARLFAEKIKVFADWKGK